MRRCDLRGAAINVGAFELEEMPVVWEQIQLTEFTQTFTRIPLQDQLTFALFQVQILNQLI